MPIRFVPIHYDNFEGTAVTISSDEGKSWSGLKNVFGPRRMHANLVRLPNDDLVMTVVRRLHLGEDGRLASYRRGCDAVVSRDNGRTRNVDHLYVLDEFNAIGSVLTTYGNYKNGAALIHWKP